MDEEHITKRVLKAIKDLTNNVPVNYQELLFIDPLENKLINTSKHITDLCADLGKYEVVHPLEITTEWMETSLYYTCDLLKKHKDTLWDLLHDVTLQADDFWSLTHKFLALYRDFESDSSDKFEFLRKYDSMSICSSKCSDGKTFYEFMTEVVPSAHNIVGNGMQFPVTILTNRLLQQVALLQRAIYVATREYGEDYGSRAEENNKTYNACVRHIIKNNIWFNSFASYIDESVRINCGLIEYYIYKEQKEKQ